MSLPITALAAGAATTGSFPIRAFLFIINQSIGLDQVDHLDQVDQSTEEPIL